MILPVIYSWRRLGTNSKQSNLFRWSSMTGLPSYSSDFCCVSSQYPRNRTTFLCRKFIRQCISFLNFSSSTSIVSNNFFTATGLFPSIPCNRSSPCHHVCRWVYKTATVKKRRRNTVGRVIEDCRPCKPRRTHLCRVPARPRNYLWWLPKVIMEASLELELHLLELWAWPIYSNQYNKRI